MSEDDKRLISWALRSYAERLEQSVMNEFTPKGNKRDAERARQLADMFYPYSWIGVKYSTSSGSILKDAQTLVEAPSNLTASSNEVGQVSFNWTDNSGGEAGFSIQSLALLGEVEMAPANATSKTVARDPGTEEYIVKAFKVVNGIHYYSVPSNVAVGTAL